MVTSRSYYLRRRRLDRHQTTATCSVNLMNCAEDSTGHDPTDDGNQTRQGADVDDGYSADLAAGTDTTAGAAEADNDSNDIRSTRAELERLLPGVPIQRAGNGHFCRVLITLR